jgi:hypothetical protein
MQIVEKIKANDNRIICIRNKENESPLVSRFKPVSLIRSEYILFLDSDDELMQSACEKIFNVVNNEQYDIVEFGYKCIYSNASYMPSCFKNGDRIKDLLCKKNKYPYVVWNKAYKYSLILQAKEKMEFFYCNMGEDVYCSVVVYSLTKNKSSIDDELYLYNDSNGMSTNRRKRDINELFRIMESSINSLYGIIGFINTYNTSYTKYLKRFIWDYQVITLNFLFSHADTNHFNSIIKQYKKFKNSKLIISIYENFKWRIIRLIKK